ncbi:hypothetical protein KC19_1G242700 [Ceratodon purpureus]|uniref:Uncharacterized protein n=1 Tax=Ceratodon purpureus TaxID=3225 RepID=A0A8T0J8S7_CERPU|nr:hypothetical protein KC19_1G242700 [Ceratodon purpureus]
MGARPEPVPQVVQTPANSVSALQGEVHDISQAIKSIRWERQLQEAQGKQVAPEPSNPLTFSLTSCLCGMPIHSSERKELGGSEMDEKPQAASCKCVCRLLILLSDSYFRLGRAYKEDGQFNRALNAVELACLTRDFPLPSVRRFSFFVFQRRDFYSIDTKEFDWRMRRLTPPPKEAFFPKGLFKSHASILAGDSYFEAQRTFDDSHVAIPHQEGEELKISQEVKEEVNRVKWSCRCFNLESLFTLENYWNMPRIVENKWEQNLLAAAKCYLNALSLSDHDEDSENEGSGFIKIACRKIGFVYHEYGRRFAELLGWHAKDKTDEYFRKAIKAFHKGKDLPNFKLALCSRIEHHRKLAEFCETQQEAQISAKEAIRKAMDLYNKLDRKQEVTSYSQYQLLDCRLRERLFESVNSDVPVDTEEADTYLKLGIMLMRQDKIYYDNQEEPNRKGWISAEEAINEAKALYQKLDCKQRVAYSQYQLGCVLRDKLLFEFVKSDATQLPGDKLIKSWLNASKYYLAVRDTDMFLRIRMEHSDLYSAIHVHGWEQALIQMLQGCGAVIFDGSSVSEEPFIRKLLELLRDMLQPNIASSSSPSMADDYEFLAGMYRCALKLKGEKDYYPLYNMWKTYASVKS